MTNNQLSPLLKVQSLTKIYRNQQQALNGLNLTIYPKDFYGLLGANGAGKTTFIGILTDLVTATSGEIFFKNLNYFDHKHTLKSQIAVVPQEFNFNIFEKVEDIIVNQAGFFGIPYKQAKRKTDQLLEELSLSDKANITANKLSGGMKRRLMIARALVSSPELLILDEPTAGVDLELRQSMWTYLKKLNQSGTTILLTTHYLEEAENMCNRIAIIKDGQTIKEALKSELVANLSQHSYLLTVSNPKKLKIPQGFQETSPTELFLTVTNPQQLSQSLHILHQHEITLIDIKPTQNKLELLYTSYLTDPVQL